MAEVDSRKNGAVKVAGLPDGWEEWPTMAQACERLGLTRWKLSEHVRKGRVKKFDAPNSKGSALGSYRFDPDELDRFEEVLASEADEPAQAVGNAEVNRAAVEALKASQSHVEALVRLFEDPYKSVLDALRDENNALRADNKTLRDERATLEELREQMRSTHAAEMLLTKQIENESKTRDQAIELAKPVVKHFINAALMRGGVDPRVIALKDAVETIPRTTFEALFASGILPEEIIDKLKFGLDWQESPPPAAKEPAK